MATPVTIVPTDCNHYTFFGYMGITCALVLGNFGAAYGTAKSGVGVCSAVVLKPELLFKSIIPIVMAGILGIYGLIVAVLFNGDSKFYFISYCTARGVAVTCKLLRDLSELV